MSLIKDLALSKELSGSEITFMDINEERLNAVFSLAKRFSKEVKSVLSIKKTTNLDVAVKDANFVINVAFAGGYDNLGLIIETAEKHGYYRGIDATEWNMVNNYNIYTGYKQYLIALNIAKRMEELAPEGWLLQVANPLLELTTMLLRKTKVKVVGFCHGFQGYKDIARVCGLNLNKIEFQVVGLNHDIWLTYLAQEGEDVYPYIDEWLKKDAEKFWDTNILDVWKEHLSRAAADMYKRYGLYPVGDTARSGTWIYHNDLKTKQKWYGPIGGVDSEIGWIIRQLRYKSQLKKFYNMANNANISLSQTLGLSKSREQFVDFIDSIINNVEHRLILNIRNNGVIPNIPNDVAIEIPVYVSKNKFRPEQIKKLPKTIVKFALIPRWEKMEWALAAFDSLLEGGKSAYKEMLVNILINDPRTTSIEQVTTTIDALMDLPYFKEL
jgi:alpha-galactosidase